jgi:hypothetical protein
LSERLLSVVFKGDTFCFIGNVQSLGYFVQSFGHDGGTRGNKLDNDSIFRAIRMEEKV